MNKTVLAPLFVSLAICTSGFVASGSSEAALTSDQMAILFGGDGTTTQVCCAPKDGCSGATFTNCASKPGLGQACDGIGPSYPDKGTGSYCGLPPNPPNPNAACATYVNDAFGNPVTCFQQVSCVADPIKGCVSGNPVPNTQVTGTFICQDNRVCRMIPK